MDRPSRSGQDAFEFGNIYRDRHHDDSPCIVDHEFQAIAGLKMQMSPDFFWDRCLPLLVTVAVGITASLY